MEALPLSLILFIPALPVLLLLIYITICLAYSLPYHFRMIKAFPISERRQTETWETAVEEIRRAGLAGLDLVERAQKLVARRMRYSRRNSWDTPGTAYLRGMGYCLQQAEVLKKILDRLGFDCRIVQCVRNRFPPLSIHEYRTNGGISGHVWLRVRIDNKEIDVCPGHPDNRPGVHHFQILGRVTSYRGPLKWLGHLGSALFNTYWDKKASKKGPPLS